MRRLHVITTNSFSIKAFYALALGACVTVLAQQASAAPVVYLAGDSTVMTYKSGYNLYPQQGWGGRLPDMFTTGVTFSNRAIGGRSSKSFVDEGRLASILSVIQPGDYLFIQFGHNDGSSNTALHTDPFTSYKTYLSMYIDLARQYGAIPVLLTPMGRRNYDSSGQFINDFVDRCTAVKELAAEKNVPLIDLNTKSIAFYNGIGAPATGDVFLWLNAGDYPNFPNGVSDNTHFQEYGASQLARLVAEGIEENQLGIRSFIGAVTYPAEAAVLSGAGTVREKTNTGWQGQGYVNFPATGGALTFNHVIGRDGGPGTLRIRYANGGPTARTGKLVVNGSATPITFKPTASWTSWVTEDVPITLNSGTDNTIALQSTGCDLANIDDLTVL
jgi:lysophospholipase L1-like esterase